MPRNLEILNGEVTYAIYTMLNAMKSNLDYEKDPLNFSEMGRIVCAKLKATNNASKI